MPTRAPTQTAKALSVVVVGSDTLRFSINFPEICCAPFPATPPPRIQYPLRNFARVSGRAEWGVPASPTAGFAFFLSLTVTLVATAVMGCVGGVRVSAGGVFWSGGRVAPEFVVT